MFHSYNSSLLSFSKVLQILLIPGFGFTVLQPVKDIGQTYKDTFTSIGGKVFLVNDIAGVKALIKEHFDVNKRIITTLPQLADTAELYSATVDPHSFDDVELAVLKAQLAVAENGAVWLTEQLMGQRILPYICQHLAVIVSA